MFFTQEDYRKIEKWLLANSRKDTDFVGAATPLKGNETVVLVQDGKNVKTSVKDIVDQFFLLGVSDFLNITDKYGESYISLTQAIQLIPFRSRKIGQVITFIDEFGNWSIYQFQGKALNQWNNTTLWIDLIAKISGIPLIDSEDITTKENGAKQVSLYLADKQYNEAEYSGLGKIYLRKNIQTIIDPSTEAVINVNLLTQSMLAKENTTYIIQYDYNLNKQIISIPEGSVLLFEGGSIDDGTINCNSTTIVDKFSGNATIVGTYSFQDAQADEEDITQNQSSVLKFKDRKYEPDKYSGLGRVILRKNIVEIDDPIYGKVTKNILFQDMIAQANTIYEIRYDYNLNGNTVTIPEGCILDMRGGSVTNGTINCVDTIIISTDASKLDVTLTGTYRFDSEKLVTSNTEDINIIQSIDRKSHTISAMLANRDTTNGMGYVILRKDKSFKEQVTQENTIYEIRYDFDLNGEEITIPEGCVLDFQGGSLNNGTIVGNSTAIVAPLVRIFDSLILSGNFLGSGYPEWYGTIAGKTSVCLIESMTSLYKVYTNIELQEGKYYAHSGKSIQCKSLEGKGRSTLIEVTGYTDDYSPFILGKLGGSTAERTWNQTIKGIRIEMRESGVLRTSCLSIGATTRCLIDNITCWNYAKRTHEFTSDELTKPEDYCNYGIIIHGAIELTSMTNFVVSGDIGVYLKTSTDVFTMLNGYIESTDFGFGGMYGRPIGTNSSISNVDITLGLYGFYFKTSSYDQGRFLIKNVRIEQLRKLYINDSVVGCNVYIDGTTGSLTPSYIENLGISGTSNGFYLKGTATLSISKVYGSSGTSQNEFDFKIEGNTIGLRIREYLASINGGFDIPNGYMLEGIESIQLNGITYYKPKAGNQARIYYPNEYVFDNRFTSINNYQYRRQFCKYFPKSYSHFATFNSRVRSNIVIAKISITIFDKDNYSSAIYIVKYQQDENGNPNGYVSDVKMVQLLGDDIMSNSNVNGKFCLTWEVGSPNLSIYNLLGKEIQSIIEFELYTKGII